MNYMQVAETVMERVSLLLGAEVETIDGKHTVKKSRTLYICNEKLCFACTLELDISIKQLRPDGKAINFAEILLLPEEVEAFTSALVENNIPFPIKFRQWTVENPHIVAVNLETVEPPEHFAGRLAAALQLVEPKEELLDFKTS